MSGQSGIIAIAAGLAIGLAVVGGALGQGKAISASLDSIGRNPAAAGKLLTPMLLGLALVESLVILAFVIAYLLYSQIGG
jgi:F-type H+-transporting ATPase subunit c